MLTDEIGGVLPIGIDAVAAMSELEWAGKIKHLGITGTDRSKLILNVPTFRESGAEGFELTAALVRGFRSRRYTEGRGEQAWRCTERNRQEA